ncbi:hypothetical protein TRFO_41547 [Tritrichomonas foetus]|uniref:Uncharacterized protein n=1 Tax=Tritrichomonas foetus TaxID=1144522 RepID=A0A1J4L133_9EUKA|nr:hypothetical protein TRFO_41547 [Tritrichomonas foetus]|eukprot:OHT16792.1 hypothetical protein TRFO_41547 [Tritrichomonas foetus]
MRTRNSTSKANYLSSSLERILRSYEETDCILFEPVTLPKAAEIKSNIPTRKSNKNVSHSILHSNPQRPLPSLAEDEDTRELRAHVSELEHQSLDLTVQIQLMQQKIDELERQLAEIVTHDVPNNLHPITPPNKARLLHSPELRRERQITPRGMTPKSRAAYYRDKFEKVRAQYEGLTRVLSQQGQITRISANGLKHIRAPRKT